MAISGLMNASNPPLLSPCLDLTHTNAHQVRAKDPTYSHDKEKHPSRSKYQQYTGTKDVCRGFRIQSPSKSIAQPGTVRNTLRNALSYQNYKLCMVIQKCKWVEETLGKIFQRKKQSSNQKCSEALYPAQERRTRTLVWCVTFTSLFTERFCWKFCTVKLVWEVSLSSFSLPCWKWNSLFDFSWWVTLETSHSRRNVRMEQWESPHSLPSFIQQIWSYSPKCIYLGIYDWSLPAPRGQGYPGHGLALVLTFPCKEPEWAELLQQTFPASPWV